MILNHNLYNLVCDQAKNVRIDFLSLGLGYTAVATSDGGIGIAYTYFFFCVLPDRQFGFSQKLSPVKYAGNRVSRASVLII